MAAMAGKETSECAPAGTFRADKLGMRRCAGRQLLDMRLVPSSALQALPAHAPVRWPVMLAVEAVTLTGCLHIHRGEVYLGGQELCRYLLACSAAAGGGAQTPAI